MSNVHLRDIAANRLIAFVIWEAGVPQVAPAAEQRDTHPQEGTPAAEQRADTLGRAADSEGQRAQREEVGASLEPAPYRLRQYAAVGLGCAPEPLEWQRRAACARNPRPERRPPIHNATALEQPCTYAVSRESHAALLQSMPTRSGTAAEHAKAEYAWRRMPKLSAPGDACTNKLHRCI